MVPRWPTCPNRISAASANPSPHPTMSGKIKSGARKVCAQTAMRATAMPTNGAASIQINAWIATKRPTGCGTQAELTI
jgi:hypothetical protein